MAKISTHILDTAAGKPAVGVKVELKYGGVTVGDAITNTDGRTDAPLLAGDAIPTGFYDLVFYIGQHFQQPGVPFLNAIVIRFGVDDPNGHYHVPLLVSPHGYTTYRGS